MATRSRETFKKRQKELLRAEKARDKAAQRLARKAAKAQGLTSPDSDIEAAPEDTPETEEEHPADQAAF